MPLGLRFPLSDLTSLLALVICRALKRRPPFKGVVPESRPGSFVHHALQPLQSGSEVIVYADLMLCFNVLPSSSALHLVGLYIVYTDGAEMHCKRLCVFVMVHGRHVHSLTLIYESHVTCLYFNCANYTWGENSS